MEPTQPRNDPVLRNEDVASDGKSHSSGACSSDTPTITAGDFQGLFDQVIHPSLDYSSMPMTDFCKTESLVLHHSNDYKQTTLAPSPATHPAKDVNLMQSIELTPSMAGFDISMPLPQSDKGDTQLLKHSSRENSVFFGSCESDLDWSTFRLPSIAFLEEASDLPKGLTHYNKDSSGNGLMEDKAHSDLGGTASKRNARQVEHSTQDITRYSKDYPTVCLDDVDAEAAIWPLQLVKQHLQLSSDSSRYQWHVSNGSTVNDLFNLVKSRCISIQLENLLLQVYEASARVSRRRRLARMKSTPESDVQHEPEESNANSEPPHEDQNSLRRHFAATASKCRFTSYSLSKLPRGALSIRLKTAGRDHLNPTISPQSWVLSITSMPMATGRTKGLTAVFMSSLANDDSLRIPPLVNTINMVPEDADIIRCISSNDALGVKRIFNLEEASPQDLDPYGFSLLSVSVLVPHAESDDC